MTSLGSSTWLGSVEALEQPAQPAPVARPSSHTSRRGCPTRLRAKAAVDMPLRSNAASSRARASWPLRQDEQVEERNGFIAPRLYHVRPAPNRGPSLLTLKGFNEPTRQPQSRRLGIATKPSAPYRAWKNRPPNSIPRTGEPVW